MRNRTAFGRRRATSGLAGAAALAGTLASWLAFAPNAYAHAVIPGSEQADLELIRQMGWAVLWRQWELYPTIVGGLVLAAVVYVWRARGLARTQQGPSAFRIFCFFSGLLTLFLALCSGIDLLSDVALQSVHMAQHMLLMFIAAPLLLLGFKGMADGLPRWIRRPLAIVTKPSVAVISSFAIMYVWHFPYLYDLALAHEPVHVLEHLMYIGGGALMWWPLVEPIADLDRPVLTPPVRVMYALAEHFPMFPLILIFMTSDQLFYAGYGENPIVLGFSPLSDQVGSGIVMLGFAALTFIVSVTPEFFRLLEDSGPSEAERALIEQVLAEQRRREREAQEERGEAPPAPL